MANSHLIGTNYEIPEEVLEQLQLIYNRLGETSGIKGIKRLKGLLDKKYCSYEQLKRIKNYFDNLDPDNINRTEFDLNGGEMMSKWVSWKLEKIRKAIYNNKLAGRNAGREDQFRKNDDQNLSPADVNPEVKNKRSVMDPPDLMSTNDLMEQINKMKKLIKK